MLDIQNLERRWLKYKIKHYAPYIAGLSIALSGIIFLLIWLYPKQPVSSVSSQSTNNSIPKKEPVITKTSPRLEDNRTVLEPSMNFVQSFEVQTQPVATQSISLQTSQKAVQKIASAVTVPKTVNMPEIPTTATNVTSSSEKTLSINRNDSKLDIESLQRRFKETSNANLGLFIARYYYDQGNYNEAYNYALKTNTANSKIDESWLIFSKALVKLGKAEQAKKTLQVYISQSNSENAKSLLDSIEKGNFK